MHALLLYRCGGHFRQWFSILWLHSHTPKLVVYPCAQYRVHESMVLFVILHLARYFPSQPRRQGRYTSEPDWPNSIDRGHESNAGIYIYIYIGVILLDVLEAKTFMHVVWRSFCFVVCMLNKSMCSSKYIHMSYQMLSFPFSILCGSIYIYIYSNNWIGFGLFIVSVMWTTTCVMLPVVPVNSDYGCASLLCLSSDDGTCM